MTDQIRENYARLGTQKLEQIAVYEAIDLHPAAIPLLIEELERRSVDPSIIRAVEVQSQPLDLSEQMALEDQIRLLPCPSCGKQEKRLQAGKLRSVTSFVVITNYSKKEIICCPDCLERDWKSAIYKTAALGWWGIPMGLLSTPHALILGIREYRIKDRLDPKIMKQFIARNRGILYLSQHSTEKLRQILLEFNFS